MYDIVANGCSWYDVAATEIVVPPCLLKFVIDLKTLILPCVLKLYLNVGMGMHFGD